MSYESPWFDYAMWLRMAEGCSVVLGRMAASFRKRRPDGEGKGAVGEMTRCVLKLLLVVPTSDPTYLASSVAWFLILPPFVSRLGIKAVTRTKS